MGITGFLEKDIEDFLCAYPMALNNAIDPFRMIRWVSRQSKLPSGVADLFGLCVGPLETSYPIPIVAELKLGSITSEALAQVSRYRSDLYEAIWANEVYMNMGFGADVPIAAIVVGSSVSKQVMLEARAMEISVACYQPSFFFFRESIATEDKQSAAASLTRYSESEEIAALSNTVCSYWVRRVLS